jgi:hypothetical protein
LNRYININKRELELRHLWPSIEVIKSNLQTEANQPQQFPEQEDVAHDSATSANVEMPVFIRERIRKRLASREAKFDTQPKSGQIWRFDHKQENISILCVLLDKQRNEYRWLGWLAAAETDYATHLDVLLEPQDEPFDPLAGMVQTWNPVSVDIREGSRVLAQLADHRLEAIREVASGKCDEGGGARPGFIAPLKTHSGATVLSGTRITHPEDPRHDYQKLYRAAAQPLDQPELSANYTYLEVCFKPDTREIDIRKLLILLNASIVDGPSEFGQYRVKIKAGSEQSTVQAIRESSLADSVVEQSK